MDWLIVGGSVLVVMGLCILGYCIYAAMAAKRAGLDDVAMRARLQKIVAINMGALLLSTIGLMTVVMGVFLG